MPGDDLLFQRLSVSTIGAVRFHGRVRDGIGWDTDAMVTRQWSRRIFAKCISMLFFQMLSGWSSSLDEQLPEMAPSMDAARAMLSLMVEFSSMNRVIRTG